jgi:hypothetical protein
VLFATLALWIASFGLVGALIAIRQPLNPIGWILWFSATFTAIGIGGSDYAGFSVEHLGSALPATVLVAWLSSWLFVLPIGLTLIFIPLLFPDGHLPGRRWLPVAWFGVVAIIGACLIAFRPGPLSNVHDIENPFGVGLLEPAIDRVGFPPGSAMILAILMALASTVARFRSGGPVERRQLKWFGFVLIIAVAIFALVPDDLNLLSFGSIALLPIGIGIAILRYRLYEIDRIISRTVSYAIVTAILGGVFVGAVLVLQELLSPVTGSNTGAIAGSTLVVATLFQPLRRRIQAGTDRRFNRSRYDAQQTAAAFAGRVRDEVDLAQLNAEVVRLVEQTVQPARVAVWLRERSG